MVVNYSVNDLTCIDLIKKWEGLRLKVYLCPAGIRTIGVGNTKYPRLNPDVKEITEDQANSLLLDDLKSVCDQLLKLFNKDKVELNINQFSACVSLTFNIGFGAFSGSRAYRTGIKLDPNNYDGIKSKWEQWSHVGSTVVKGLLNRRIDEFELYCTPILKSVNNSTIDEDSTIINNSPDSKIDTKSDMSFWDYLKQKFNFKFKQ